MWSIATIICINLGVGRGVEEVVHSDNYLCKSCSRGGGGAGCSIAMIICTSIRVRGVVHSDD